jgi:hypothetical protein
MTALTLSHVTITDDSIDFISQHCTLLTRVHFNLPDVTVKETTLVQLIENNPLLQAIDISLENETSLKVIEAITSHCPHIQSVGLSDVLDSALGASLELIVQASELKSLSIGGQFQLFCNTKYKNLGQVFILALQSENENLVENCDLLTDFFTKCVGFRGIQLSNVTALSDATLLAISKSNPQLSDFQLNCCGGGFTFHALQQIFMQCSVLKTVVLTRLNHIHNHDMLNLLGNDTKVTDLSFVGCLGIDTKTAEQLVLNSTGRTKFLFMSCENVDNKQLNKFAKDLSKQHKPNAHGF